jgi:glutamyl-tRNA(Gln) amidotransferase subunit E (EC 6.3.5.7)
MSELDYEAVGLVAGLEIHQQLDTSEKLFCESPTKLRDPDEAEREITRYLHPTKSELGELDEAALEESRVDREFTYLGYDTTCLVEEDDEPPRRVDREATTVALQIASLLDLTVVDQAHVMRKLVIDGSNTSGFQRSILLGQNGQIDTEDGPVGIADLMLEEESAQRVEETDSGVVYSLDRLGIPLVEIGTAPDISTPAQAREAAERIGTLLRATGQVKRGLGTIRQDVNISIADGARVEIKGVQDLDGIESIVRNEVRRQMALLEIAETLQDREASVDEPVDVTELFSETESGVIRQALGDDSAVMAVCLRGFDGLVGREIQPDRRLGTEFSDHAKRHGVGGIFHTDELPTYGITDTEVTELRQAVEADDGDAVAIVAAGSDPAQISIDAVAERAITAIKGVPEETRDANDDGTTRYLRPLPGAARLYPETDVPPVEPDTSQVQEPELLSERETRYREEYELGTDLAQQVVYGGSFTLFEEAVEAGVDPTLAATTVESTTTELRRQDVTVADLTDQAILGTLKLASAGDLAREGIPEVLEELARHPELSPEAAVEEAGLTGVQKAEIRSAVETVVEQNAEQVANQGMGAFSALMGEAMGSLRGKADGEVISELLREEISNRS